MQECQYARLENDSLKNEVSKVLHQNLVSLDIIPSSRTPEALYVDSGTILALQGQKRLKSVPYTPHCGNQLDCMHLVQY